jgi:hypothetical protein
MFYTFDSSLDIGSAVLNRCLRFLITKKNNNINICLMLFIYWFVLVGLFRLCLRSGVLMMMKNCLCKYRNRRMYRAANSSYSFGVRSRLPKTRVRNPSRAIFPH